MEQAVRLLAEVAPRELDREDQLHAVGEMAGLAGDAAALVLADDSRPERARAETALRLLEFGRARVTAQLLETRTGVAELRAHHPQTAHRFLELRASLDQPEPADAFLEGDEGVTVQDQQARRRTRAGRTSEPHPRPEGIRLLRLAAHDGGTSSSSRSRTRGDLQHHPFPQRCPASHPGQRHLRTAARA